MSQGPSEQLGQGGSPAAPSCAGSWPPVPATDACPGGFASWIQSDLTFFLTGAIPWKVLILLHLQGLVGNFGETHLTVILVSQ